MKFLQFLLRALPGFWISGLGVGDLEFKVWASGEQGVRDEGFKF